MSDLTHLLLSMPLPVVIWFSLCLKGKKKTMWETLIAFEDVTLTKRMMINQTKSPGFYCKIAQT